MTTTDSKSLRRATKALKRARAETVQIIREFNLPRSCQIRMIALSETLQITINTVEGEK